MENNLKPIWELAGLNRAEFCVLPTHEKIKIIRRHCGISIMDENHRQYEIRRARKANEKWNSSFGLLLEAYK